MIIYKLGAFLGFNHTLENNDIILMDDSIARRVLGVPSGFYTDAVIKIANEDDTDFVARYFTRSIFKNYHKRVTYG